MTDVINSFRGDYRFLSNFFVEPDGTFVERDFQAGKATNANDLAFVLASSSPSEAKHRGRQVELRKDWDNVKVKLMLQLLRKKFTDHPILAEKLLATGDARLIEGNTWGDTFWGVVNGKGKNMLGLLLHLVRCELRKGILK